MLDNVINDTISKGNNTPKYMKGNVLHIINTVQSCCVHMFACYGCLKCDSLGVGGDKAVCSRKEPRLRYDRSTTNMSVCPEVKADLPGPLPQLSVLPSYDAVQLIGPGATI